MATKEILLKIEWKDMDSVVLTNSKGDTYTSKSEELHDFLHSEPSPEWYKKQIDIAKKNFTKDFNGSLEQYAVDNFIAGANWQSTPATPEQDELAKAKQEIERLKGLIENAWNGGYDASSYAHDSDLQGLYEKPHSFQQFKTDNNL